MGCFDNYLYQMVAKQVLKLLLLVFIFSSQTLCQKPNIIMILSDDMGYADLGCYGSRDNHTPHLDRIAREGVQFNSAYSAGPMCTPTRTALLTGRYPARTTVGLIEPLTTKKRDADYGLTNETPSLGIYLKSAGYETRLIGKWHLGFQPRHSPLQNGFDQYFGFLSGASDYISHDGDGRTPDLFRNDTAVHVDGYLTDLFTQEAVKFIGSTHTQPFFLLLTYNAPHWPWQGRKSGAYPDTMDYTAGGSKEIYREMITALDDGVGEILNALQQNHLDSSTLVIFTNDNGGERYSNNGINRQGKMTLWEGGIRVPAMMRWPGHLAQQQVNSLPVITMDWTATILAAATVKPNDSFPLDGLNLIPQINISSSLKQRTFYWRTYQRSKQKAIMKDGWKYLKIEKDEYLFNLRKDPGETTNLKNRNPIIFSRLKRLVEYWETTVLPPIPMK